MFGYCATGKVKTAMKPASVMMIDSTPAKMGRSMKKWEIKARPRAAPGGSRSVLLYVPLVLGAMMPDWYAFGRLSSPTLPTATGPGSALTRDTDKAKDI